MRQYILTIKIKIDIIFYRGDIGENKRKHRDINIKSANKCKTSNRNGSP